MLTGHLKLQTDYSEYYESQCKVYELNQKNNYKTFLAGALYNFHSSEWAPSLNFYNTVMKVSCVSTTGGGKTQPELLSEMQQKRSKIDLFPVQPNKLGAERIHHVIAF